MSTQTDETVEIDVDTTVPCEVTLCGPQNPECDAPATHRVRVVHDFIESACITLKLCTPHAEEFVQQWRLAEVNARVMHRAFGCKAHEVPCHVHADPL